MQTTDGRKIKLVGGQGDYTVQVKHADGSGNWDAIGNVRQRAEVYSGMRRGGTYYYWDATGADGRRVVRHTWQCGRCGGDVQSLVNAESGGFKLPTCLSCGRVYHADKHEHPVMVNGPQLTTSRDRDSKLSASTRRDAIDALLRATGHEGLA